MELIKNPNFDFLGKARYFVVLSLILIGAGIALMVARGGPAYGVEFSGGTQLIVQFSSPPQIDRVRDAVGKVDPGAVIQTYGESKGNKVLIRIAGHGDPSGGELDTLARKVLKSLADSYPQNPATESSSEIVGPVVGAELRQKAVTLTVLGLLFQLIYIAARFKGGIWGVAASLAAV